MFECLIITEKDAGYHLIAKQQDHKKLYTDIVEFGILCQQLVLMLKDNKEEIIQNIAINLIITLLQINPEYQTYLTSNANLFQAICDLMFSKLNFFESYLSGKEDDPYLVRI